MVYAPDLRHDGRTAMQARRLFDRPIITAATPGADPLMQQNINGPSLLRVPDWVPAPLGRYYLYFAHHAGDHIRMAYADELAGPWRVHAGGVLQLADSHFERHIASPHVYVDQQRRRIHLYYHGMMTAADRVGIVPEIDERFFRTQRSRVALSDDGLHFEAQQQLIAPAYLRVVALRGMLYGISMPGLLCRSADGFGVFESGPLLPGDDARREDFFFPPGKPSVRHLALHVDGDTLYVFCSRQGDAPEHVMMTTVDVSEPDWHRWQPEPLRSLLLPEMPWEGGGLPIAPSDRGAVHVPVCQLRDPCPFQDDDGRLYLLYTVQGEQGIALAELRA